MAELGQRTVEFPTLVRRAAEDSFLSLKELVEKSKSPEQSDSEKKISLLKYIVKTRQRMLRLLVLAKWCQQVPLVQYCQQLAATLSSHDTCFTQAADSMFFMHEGLQQARAPIYDVPSAIEVLLTGNYQRLPKCIEDMGIQSALTEAEQGPALKKLDTLLRAKLLEVSLPKEISEVTVSDGTALLRVDGEFKVLLTLGYRGHLSMWRILHLELLVGEKSGLVKLEEMRRHVLGDDLERRMAASENPFFILYSILHELCVALIMDTVIRQVQVLRQGRWKDVIRFELITDGSMGQAGNPGSMQLGQDVDSDSAGPKTPGLKIMYWLDIDKNAGGSDLGSPPFIKIEPGQDLRIKCLHDSFVIDPLTGNEAEFSLNQSCIDVEKLLLRAIACNKHTHLLEIHKELLKNSQICQAAGDVVLKCHGDELDADFKKKDNKSCAEEYGIDEVLLVRAYGSLYITLGINIRSGRFLLQSSRNILASSALLDCEEALNQGSMNAADVFISLRSKSILHLFASIGRFLGLKGLAAVKMPKTILNGSDSLLMGFPQCGSSYYLLMQLDKDFKPLFKLLETQPDPCGRSPSVGDSNHIIRFNKIDVGQMQMVEDELNLSLLDWEKLVSSLPSVGGPNQTPEHGLLSEIGQEASLQMAGFPQSIFSSVVDKVFELEKGASAPPFPMQNHLSSSFNTSSLSHFGSVPNNLQGIKSGLTSLKWEGGSQLSQVNNITKISSGGPPLNSSPYPSNNIKALLQSGPVNSFSPSPVRSPSLQRVRSSKSDQELSSHKSPPHSFEVGPRSGMDEDQVRLLKETSKELAAKVSAGRPTRVSSPLRAGPRVVGPSMKANVLRNIPTGNMVGPLKTSGSSPWTTSPVCPAPESWISNSPSCDVVPKHDKDPRKRSLSDVLKLIPSLQGVEASTESRKRRKISESANCYPAASESLCSSVVTSKTEGYTYGSILAEANHGRAPSSIYVAAFLHVVRHCSLCIKHARLTSQMDALDIPYVEEVGLRTPSSNLWFRLPFARDDSWQHICLRLGKPGSMYWDVKVNDQHFRDLWDLQKDSSSTPWGYGVRIANTSDVDSHIRYDSEGVVLSYKTVEDDSIQKLVADLRRLSNARLFALGMRKLLGVRAEDKLEDGGVNSENKVQSGIKGATEVADKTSEQMRRAFRIEAVGLMSLWFSFGSMPAIMARFVVEWEAGKDGCTMHVSPDQLWPHTKFLEDFINGAEVASLLDCIRLTAGPLIALAGAIRPARMTGPASPGIHGVTAGLNPAPKQNGFVPPSQGLLPSSSTSNTNQSTTAAPVGNPVAGAVMGPLGNHSLQSVAMLSVAGRGGPGIVPSSLLPIDVSVVLRGPYWIRIIYRKNFAVDMRCFAGDQVWLQPATPAKKEPEGGGSLPCPQFRPFIMEHVAQGLNALETNFTVGAPTVGPVNSSIPNPSSGSQPPVPNGNRLNLTGTAGISRPTSMGGNQGGNLSRVSNAMLASSSLTAVGSGLPIRAPQGAGVPVHVRGDLNTAFIGLGDDGGYGGGWVPLAALKKVLRGILKYLGVLWLFAQLPGLLKEILGSILKENEGALLNLDNEQPALRFFVGGYVFAVSVHRVQLLLQVLSVKRFHQQQQQQQQQNQANAQDELAPTEISEICDYFSRRVASEPYDASRVASFITLLTLPISVLREFLRLIAWKKGLSQPQGADMAPAQRPRIELCLENHAGYNTDENSDNPCTSKSNIHYDRPRNAVDFGLTFVLDPAHIPHINAAGGAAWLPYCVSVRLRYSFGESTHISLVGMEGSHGGRACWSRVEDWEKCKQRVARAVEYGSGSSVGDGSQGRLKIVAETLQRALQISLQQLRDGSVAAGSAAT
ncbi:mediator of RNA polymerase II transcription subunit 14 isoform X2 [Magnolia sinica]|uniref:mediator of RNA polymerase II transcription subunit 14 isoform X2 n=1 Tax=Magnolia sinica TaxID=86752 RepID=UPI00265ABCFF|nr:mediator of RNA polymerase II transcription subunit 14 isoform X2 [Magnolia sinica]